MSIWMTFRKISHNKGLLLSLLLGMVLVGALVSLIPAYANMSLNRTFRNDLETYQQETGVYPGMTLVSAFYNENGILDVLNDLKQAKTPAFLDERLLSALAERKDDIDHIRALLDTLDDRIGMGALIRIDNLASTAMQITVSTSHGNVVKTGKLQSLTGLGDNITLLRGVLPGARQGDTYQALATEEALLAMDMEVGDVVSCVPRLDTTVNPILVRITGTFDVDPDKPLAWGFFKRVMFRDSLLINSDDAQSLLLGSPVLAASVRSYLAYDYGQMLSVGLTAFKKVSGDLNRELHAYGASFDMPILGNEAAFAAREKALKITLWMLNIPVLIMLALYMTMISGQVVENDAGEIALLVSRGANRRFIFAMYLVIGLFLALLSILLGPPLSRLLCYVLGSTNGFLSFVRRSVPVVHIGIDSYLYCAAALLIAVGMLLLTAMRKYGVSIVRQKQMAGEKEKPPLWDRLYLDVLLLALSVAAWYLMRTQPQWLTSAGELNPFIFALMPCFAVGATLLFLRLYPHIVQLIGFIGRRFWRASAYLSLLRVSRGMRSYRYIMVFLSLTIAVGMFSASAARTLNNNETDRLAYLIGADVRLSVSWPRQGAQNAAASYGELATAGDTAEEGGLQTRRYREPSFAVYQTLAGVQSAARVFERGGVQVTGTKSVRNAHLMAIDPADFARTAWYRNDLWTAHFYAYLNVMSMNERAVVVSNSLAKRLNVQMGDWITMGWDGSESAQFYIAGIVNYWPGWDPAAGTGSEPMLVVADLSVVQAFMAVEPYEVWLKLDDHADIQALYNDMAANDIHPVALRNFREENIALINGSNRLAVNGAMTLGFIASCIVCALGFLLYWQMYLRKNQLQLGLQRGMGFTAGQLLRMLVFEQLLTSVAALLFGVLIGTIGSALFVPLFSYAYSHNPTLPFIVRILAEDRRAIYGIIGAILLVCWLYLAVKMKRMKVAQAIKLGEDS